MNSFYSFTQGETFFFVWKNHRVSDHSPSKEHCHQSSDSEQQWFKDIHTINTS